VFGYVNIVKDDLTVREYYLFRAYYCGLCKELGHQFNNRVKIGLNYDMVFLALLLDSLTETIPKAEPIFCVLHPIHKRSALVQSSSLEYASFMSVLLTKSKLDDDKTDDGRNLKNLIGSILYHSAFKKARKPHEKTYEQICHHLDKLYKLEKQNCAIFDEVADQFGEVMRVIFTPEFIPESAQESLSALAYQIGRWIYILDAFDDLIDDYTKKRYNPLILQYAFSERDQTIEDFSQFVKGEITNSLDHTLAQIALLSGKIPFLKNKGILFNIFYLGMPQKQRQILERKKNKHE